MVLLGVITAVGGGMIRDVLTGDGPMIFRRGELYAFAAMGACLAIVAANALDAPTSIMVVVGYAIGIALRFGSLRWGLMSWVPR